MITLPLALSSSFLHGCGVHGYAGTTGFVAEFQKTERRRIDSVENVGALIKADQVDAPQVYSDIVQSRPPETIPDYPYEKLFQLKSQLNAQTEQLRIQGQAGAKRKWGSNSK